MIGKSIKVLVSCSSFFINFQFGIMYVMSVLKINCYTLH